MAAPAFPALDALIGPEPVHSAEELISRLPETYRSRYVLVFNSRSLQSASYDNPRAVLFGNDASLVVTFNGAPGQRGYDAIETMEFDAGTRQFLFRELSFGPGAGGQPELRVSAPNPPKCIVCHGNPARPVWDSFPSWPGVYGEIYLAPLSRAERDGLNAFSLRQPSHPRYRYLADLYSYAAPDTFRASDTQRYQGSVREPPNSILNSLLQVQNLAGIAAEVERSPRYPAYRYALLASLSEGCGDPADYVPERLRKAFPVALAELERDTRRNNRVEAATKRLRLLPGTAGASTEPESLDRFRYVAEQGLGITTAQWTLSLEKDTYDFSIQGSPRGELERTLAAAAVPDEPALGAALQARSAAGDEKYCAYLRRRSLSALQSMPEPPQPCAADQGRAVGLPAAAPGILQRCVACHAGGAAAPPIPFDRPDLLGAQLGRAGYPRGTLLEEIVFRMSPQAGARRMPLGQNPADADRSDLLDYLRKLARGSAGDG
ncbi:MAG: hypothetical protein P4L83_23080 [Nevskia sp.]|nr:hypothetical protein [Nevskia sp.]